MHRRFASDNAHTVARGERAGKRARAAVVAVACAAAALVACDPRACLATSPAFSGLRPELVDECCLCLAKNGTRHPGAACAETFIDADGGLAILADAGPSSRGGVSYIPVDGGPDAPDFSGDDADGKIESDEVPCLCDNDLAECRTALTSGVELVVTGSCISQGGGLFSHPAPCATACRGVLTFSPLSSTPP